MYPQRQLTALAWHKARLRQRITHRRAACGEAATQLARPFVWLDRMMALARKVQPFALMAAVPLGFLLQRSSAPRPRLLGTLLRWGPIVASAIRGCAGRDSVGSGAPALGGQPPGP